MRRIGDMTGMMEELNRKRLAYRESMIALHGWPESVRCVSCGDQGIMPDGRDCEACEPGRERVERARRLQEWHDLIPRRFRSYTLDTHPRQMFAERVRDWLAEGFPRGRNLVLAGNVGSGKTGLAIGLAREVHLTGAHVLFRTVPDLMDSLRPMHEHDKSSALQMRAVQTVPLLVMDDFGVEKSTEWVAERLYLVINGRYERGLPTVVTTNHTSTDLAEYAGQRAVSRLREDAEIIPVTGPDLRAYT